MTAVTISAEATHKLYQLMQDMVEHERQADQLRELIMAQSPIKVGTRRRTYHAGLMEAISVVPAVQLSGTPQRWQLVLQVAWRGVKKDGVTLHSRGGRMETVVLCKDWLTMMPKPGDKMPTVDELADTMRTSDQVMHAFVHGQEIMERRRTDRRNK